MNYTFTKEDVELVEKFIDIRNRGYYVDGAQLTQVYNRVLHKNVNTTSCGSCLRQRVAELETALNHFKSVSSLSEASKPELPTVMKEEENKELTEAKNGVISNTESVSEKMKERMAKVRAAKKNKK